MSSVYDTVPPPTVQKTMADGDDPGVRVAVAIDERSEHNFWADLTLDVARGGIFVATYHSLPLGTVLDIEVGIAGAEPTVLRGVVRWARGHRDGSDGSPGIGIELLEAAPDAMDLMKKFVQTVREPLLFEPDDPKEAKKNARRSRPSFH